MAGPKTGIPASAVQGIPGTGSFFAGFGDSGALFSVGRASPARFFRRAVLVWWTSAKRVFAILGENLIIYAYVAGRGITKCDAGIRFVASLITLHKAKVATLPDMQIPTTGPIWETGEQTIQIEHYKKAPNGYPFEA